MSCPVISKVVAEHFGVDLVSDQDHRVDDLGGDDLDVIELVMTLEETFNISITDDEAENLYTVQDVVNCVQTKEKEAFKL